MRITDTNEDARLLSLNRPAKTRNAETRPVEELEETRRLPAIKELREHDSRSQQKRRTKQRRKEREKVQLDTRDRRERRKAKRRREDREPAAVEETIPSQGIDVKV